MGKLVGVLTKVHSIRKSKNHFYGILFPKNRDILVPQCDYMEARAATALRRAHLSAPLPRPIPGDRPGLRRAH